MRREGEREGVEYEEGIYEGKEETLWRLNIGELLLVFHQIYGQTSAKFD